MSQYGCLPPKIDVRDFKIKSKKAKSVCFPKTFELKKPRIKNQGIVNSCVAHATSSILEYHTDNQVELSTNFIYGIQKSFLNRSNEGMYLIDACKIVQTYGDMLESDCSGNTEVPKCYTIAENSLKNENKKNRAKEFIIDEYYECSSINDIKYALMNYGPVLGCMKWYDEYVVDENGTITFYQSDYGYHAVMIYGWNENGLLIQNSWGSDFGVNGCFILPYGTQLLVEARALIDHKDGENDKALIRKKPSKIMNIFYKLLNIILNL